MVKMFSFLRRKTNRTLKRTVDLVVDASVYEQLKKRAAKEGISEDEALLHSLRGGMKDFNLHLMGEYKEDYTAVAHVLEQCKRDNASLRAILAQNEHLDSILQDYKQKQSEPRRTEL